ncbi:MAG TPA: hypothetical protein VI386_23240 [Candidatus Sulfotelmatobacter sp.]
MTISREQIRHLAEFLDTNFSALSFYYQPTSPRNKAHKEDAILVKDLVREAHRRLEATTTEARTREERIKKESARSDLDRITHLMTDFRTNGTHAKAVFACTGQNLWQEYDLPPHLTGTQLFIDRQFHLKPLAHMLGAFPALGIALVDRHRARFFDFRLGELTERESLFQPLSRKGRSDGFAGYDGGHAQRRVKDEVHHHFKAVAASLREALETRVCEKWILGCQDIHRSQLEQQLPVAARHAMLGHFHADVAHITPDAIRTQAQRLLEDWQDRCRQELMSQAIDESRSNGRAVTGLRRVLHSLELGEVQTLLVGENFVAHAVECPACGHFDAHLVSECAICGKATHEVRDVGEAILPRVIRQEVELFYVKSDPEFDKVGNIAAVLRYRAEKGMEVQPIGMAALNPSASRRPGTVGRYRGSAGG